jgi:hypothetical protein
MEILNLHLLALMIALVAFVYSDVLTESGMILNWLYRSLDNLLPGFLFKPLIGCFKCVSGQMALWYYMIYHNNYDYREHLYIICLTIFLSQLLCRIYRKTA